MNGEVNRQDYLETTLSWIIDRDGLDKIEDYMSLHQHDGHATQLWQYFNSVIDWVKTLFINYRREMKGLPWGVLYNKYRNKDLDPKQLEKQVAELMIDDEVTKKSGIYLYLLSGDEKYLNLRRFSEAQKRKAYEEQGGICRDCLKEKRDKVRYRIEEMEADHITPWRDGGKTVLSNCQMLCIEHNRIKSCK